MNKLTRILFGVIFAVALLAAPALGKGPGEAVGSVVAVRGEVKAIDGRQQERVLAMKSAIFQSDVIRTGAGGRVQLLFEDNTIVSLGSNSVLEIAKYEWDAAKQSGAMKTKVEEGSFRVLGGMITKTAPQNFTTETPAATIGIRGSMYAGSYHDNQLKVTFLGGRGIYVSNRHGRVEIDKPGFGTRATPETAPEPPFKMDSADIAVMVEGLQVETAGVAEGADKGVAATGDTRVSGGDTRRSAVAASGQQETLSPENAELLDPGTGGVVDARSINFATDLGADVVVIRSSDEVVDDVEEQIESPAEGPQGDSLNSSEDQMLIIAVDSLLANDGSHPVFKGIATFPANGTLLDNGDGTFTYQPSANFNGTDSFVYEVTDGTTTMSATVIINVTSVPDVAAMSGRAQQFLRNSVDGAMASFAQPGLTATSVDGGVTANLDGGAVLESFTMASYDPAASYLAWSWGVAGDSTTADTAQGTVTVDRSIAWDNKGEFFIQEENLLGVPANLGGEDYVYRALSFGGVPTSAAALPTAGVDTYRGHAFGGTTLGADLTYDMPAFAPAEMSVNWANGKVFGMLLPPEPTTAAASSGPYPDKYTIFYGDLAAGWASFRFVPSEEWSGNYMTVNPLDLYTTVGDVTFGQFYGREYQGFGLVTEGVDYRLYDMAAGNPWQGVVGLFREPGMTQTGPAGPKFWNGFYIGQADSLDYPTYGSVFGNLDSAEFSLTLDAASGTVTGTVMFWGVPVPFGGPGRSAYVDESRLVAEAVPGLYGYQVLDKGNFLVTAPASYQFSDYASWGYWNALLAGDGIYQVHGPGAFWVAGEQTPAAVVTSLASTAMTGTYTGPAYGVKTDLMTNTMTPLTNGSTTLTFDFASSGINGAISFDQKTLPISGLAALNGAGFQATDVVTGATTSMLAGGFFGPQAETVAGSFNAYYNYLTPDPETRYIGIFGGNVGGTPASPLGF